MSVWGSVVSVTPGVRLRADLTGDTVVLGRSRKCTVPLPAELVWVSSRHLELRPAASKGQFLVCDTSMHGTWVNTAPVGHGRRMLAVSGERVELRRPLHVSKPPVPSAYDSISVVALVVEVFSSEMRAHYAACVVPDAHPLRARYDVLHSLGTGMASVVYAGVERASGRRVAIKALRVTDALPLAKLRRELEILQAVRHPCVVPVLDHYGGGEDCREMRFIVLELADGGDLHELVRTKGPFQEGEAARIFVQLLMAVKYLHDRGIVHRDLKPENVLVVGNTCKVCDFGLATILGPLGTALTICGTPAYTSPEVIIAAQFGATSSCAPGYGKSCDIWSLGAILYVLISGVSPFEVPSDLQHFNVQRLYEDIVHGRMRVPLEKWRATAPNATDLIAHLLVLDPEERYTAEQALRHPYCIAALERLREEGGTLGSLAEQEFAALLSSGSSLAPFTSSAASPVRMEGQSGAPMRPIQHLRRFAPTPVEAKRRKTDLEGSSMML